MDQGRGLLRPDEDLQRTGAVPGFVAARQVPVLGPPRLLEEGIDARASRKAGSLARRASRRTASRRVAAGGNLASLSGSIFSCAQGKGMIMGDLLDGTPYPWK